MFGGVWLMSARDGGGLWEGAALEENRLAWVALGFFALVLFGLVIALWVWLWLPLPPMP
jgi:hypothetical protein